MLNHAVMRTEQIMVEIIDPWHPEGHRVRLPITPTGDIPHEIGKVLRYQAERPDPETRQRDPREGSYVGHSTGEDGVPIYEWEWAE